MDSFSLLNYWRGGAGGAALTAASTTVLPPPPQAETDDDDDVDAGGDQGPFFDLEFAIPGEGAALEEPDADSEDVDFVLSSDESFGGDALVPLGTESKPQLAAALLKSATKFRVFLLGFKKPKPAAPAPSGPAPASPKQQQQQSKFFIKFRVEEVPFASLFTRDATSKSSGAGDATAAAAAEEKKFTKDAVQRYFHKLKPHYIRVSRRYAEKLRLLSAGDLAAGKVTDEAEEAAAVEGQKGSPVGEAAARKRLGKSKSASAAAEAAQRRDDTLRQQQDGIQSAIAHCKRSFTAAAPNGSSETPLVRSVSEPARSTSGLAEEKNNTQ